MRSVLPRGWVRTSMDAQGSPTGYREVILTAYRGIAISVATALPGQTGMSVLLEMLDERGFGHVDSQLADVGHVIADAFEMFGHKQQPRIAGCRSGISHHHLN